MVSKTQLANLILDELVDLQKEANPVKAGRMENGFPAIIPAGDGRMIFVTPAVLDHIRDFSEIVRSNLPGVAQRMSIAEVGEVTRRAFGMALAGRELEEDRATLIPSLLEALDSNIRQAVAEARDNLTFVFGVRLFAAPVVEPIAIGPVRFEARESWLQREIDAGRLNAVVARRLRARWSGKEVRKRKVSWEQAYEDGIAKITAKCRYLCSVQTFDLASKTAEQRALLAARLALTVISLVWAMPSKTLEGMGIQYDGDVFHRHYLTTDAVRIRGLADSIAMLPEGPTPPSDWSDLWMSAQWLADPLAEALWGYTNPGHTLVRPNISNALFHALVWFHEGCRERLPILATVKFAATMDALTKGGKKQGIAKFINARMGIEDHQPLMKRGETAHEILNRIYDYARSRTIHGNNERIADDWSDTRATAESLARLCLHLACGWIADNPTDDRIEEMSKRSCDGNGR